MAETTAEQEVFARWKAEIDYAQKDTKYTSWLTQSEKIVKRYRDERVDTEKTARKFNILWSNVQTLQPAIYAKAPKPIVERRYMDRDPVARLASTILERTVSFQMEAGYFHASTQKAVLDYLLPGMGQLWFRYEPQFESVEDAAENAAVDSKEKSADDVEEDGDGIPYQKVAYERVCADYVYYRDFLWGVARCWYEVPWVARRSWLTKSEIAEKFGKAKASKVTLDYVPKQVPNSTEEDKGVGYVKKAEIWEIWNKADRTVYFIAPSTPDLVLKQAKPEFDLEGFWPCPEPLFTTQTNDTLVPVPDYVEYQDQARELDTLTQRIAMITTAIRANGVYDGSQKGLERLLQDGADNKLVPVDNWAAFQEKGGMPGAISLVPMQEIAEVLLRLYEARGQVKNDLYEITGMSDIIRGQGDAQETATAQRIKGQFASLRLQDRQDDVGRFCRDGLHIMAEIAAEMFAPESLMQMSGYEQIMADDVRKAVAKVPPPQPPPPPQGAPPPPPEVIQQMQQQAQMQFQQAQQQAAQQAQQKAIGEFEAALEILRSDKLRGFRIDIETDSTIQADAQADKESAIELFSSTLQGLEAAGAVVMQAPELLEPLGDMLMNAYRKFRVGRTMEASLEEALTKMAERMEEQAGQPKPPTPEEIKAQAEQQNMQMQMQMEQAKQQAESQRAAETHQFDMQKMQAEMQVEQQKAAMQLQMQQQENAMKLDMMKSEILIEREKLELEKEKLAIQREGMLLKAQVDAQGLAMKTEAAREQHEMDREGAEHQHALGMETMEAKAKAAKQQAKPNGAQK